MSTTAMPTLHVLIPLEVLTAPVTLDIREMELFVKVNTIAFPLPLFEINAHNISADIDECTKRTDNCHRPTNATCIDTIGSFECVCKAGYDGNGTTCFGKLFSVLIYRCCKFNVFFFH